MYNNFDLPLSRNGRRRSKGAWSLKHIFIVNPAAGVTDQTEFIREGLEETLGGTDWQLYRTKAPGDATAFVRSCCETGEILRFYACGGDGTLNEVASGAMGSPNAAVGCYPCGSGNDYVKYYGGKDAFLDFRRLVQGEARPVDVIRAADSYAVNMCHFGLDTTVAKAMNKVKNMKLIGGKHAYTTGVIKALLSPMNTRCSVSVDGEEINGGEILLCTIANGSHVGGRFKCAPYSINDDGLLDVCLVTTVSRLKFVRLAGRYAKGMHLSDPEFKDYVTYRRGKKVEINSPEPDFAVSLDGEIKYGRKITVEVMERALSFIVPEGVLPYRSEGV